MRKIGVIGMILTFIAALFGCSKQEWQSFTYHVTSSVQADGCHFVVTRDSNDTMTLSGYCFEGNTEHRSDEPKLISQETAAAIATMALQNAPSAVKKPFDAADGTQVTVTLCFSSGNERRIALSPEQRSQLKDLLQRELVQNE